MFSNRYNGRNNVIGKAVAILRKERNVSQRTIADELQLMGLDIDKNAVQRIESGQRFITDIEQLYLSKLFDVTIPEMYSIAMTGERGRYNKGVIQDLPDRTDKAAKTTEPVKVGKAKPKTMKKVDK